MSIIAAFMVPHPPMIVPQVGRGSEAQIQKTIDAYTKVAEEIAALAPETIVISSPHAVMYGDYFHISPGEWAEGSFADFRAPEVNFTEKYDAELVEKIRVLAKERNFPAGTLGERDKRLDHGTMVPLYFIRQKMTDFKIVRVGLSGLLLTKHYAFGQLIRQAVEETGRRTVYVASGDLSHKLKEYGPYGFAPEGVEYDERIMDVCSRAAFGELFDFEESFCDKAAECGHRSFVIMAGALDGVAVKAEKLSHEDVTGVGYGICTFFPTGEEGKAAEKGQKTEERKTAEDGKTVEEGKPAEEKKLAQEEKPVEEGRMVQDGKPDKEKGTDRRFLDIYMEQKRAELKKAEEQSDAYVKLARKSLEAYILHGKRITMEEGLRAIGIFQNAGTDGAQTEYKNSESVGADDGKQVAAGSDGDKAGSEMIPGADMAELTTVRAGAFVSIHEHGRLRGCIGTIQPTTGCVAEEIIQNAISASTRDPRFEPITEEELPWLELHVDVLGAPEPIPSEDMLDVKKYGVIVTSEAKRGLLLPDLDGVDTVEQQVAIAMQKGGIRQGEPIELERFEVVRHV